MSDDLSAFLARARGAAATARLVRAAEPIPLADEGVRWALEAVRGRLVELSASGAVATLSAAIELVGEAQRAGEPVGWIALRNATFYPPDVADSGIDLAALVVVRVVCATTAARAAERLLRSGAFGLVVLDLAGASEVDVPTPHQGRLVSLAQAHDAAVVCLTDKPADAASLGSLVSLRAEALRVSEPTRAITLRALKDKRRGPGWTASSARRGPAGR